MKKISLRDQNRVLHQAVNTIISTVKFGISIMGIDSLLEPQVAVRGTAGFGFDVNKNTLILTCVDILKSISIIQTADFYDQSMYCLSVELNCFLFVFSLSVKQQVVSDNIINELVISLITVLL